MPRRSTVDFDQQANAAFYDYEREGFEARYSHRMDPATVSFMSLSLDQTNQQRETAFFGDVDVTTHNVSVGLQRTFSGVTAAAFVVGYETQDYQGGGADDFTGAVFNINMNWNASDVCRFDVTVGRQPFQSFFVNNNFYVNDELRFGILQQVGLRTYWQGGIGFQKNAYGDPVDIRVTADSPPGSDLDNDGNIDAYESLLPSQGVIRLDRSLSLNLAGGIRLVPSLRLTVGYNYDVRTSNMEQALVPGKTLNRSTTPSTASDLRIEAGAL